MSVFIKQEIERLEALLKEDPNNTETIEQLEKMQTALANYKPAEVAGGTCVSCEG